MQIDTSKLTADWKSTVVGLLGCGIGVVVAVMALPPKASALVITLAVMRAVMGFLQKDAKQ
jgi:hypothetical protein